MTTDPHPTATATFDRAELEADLPYGPSFLFLDTAQIDGLEATGSYTITDNIPFLADHFKHEAVFPASIMIEAMGQLGILFLLHGRHEALPVAPDPRKLFFTSADGVRCFRVCKPGDTLTLRMKCRKIRPPLALFQGSIHCNGEKVSSVETVTLIFEPTPLAAPTS